MRAFHLLAAPCLALALAACSDSSDSADGGPTGPAMTGAPTVPPAAGAGQVVDLGQGLKREVLEEGKGPVAQPGSHVDVHYTCWIKKTGKKADSSYDMGQPLHFTLGTPPGPSSPIMGWHIGLGGVREGSKVRLDIPSHLAYAGNPAPGDVIPPYSDLLFEIDLLKVYAPDEPHGGG